MGPEDKPTDDPRKIATQAGLQKALYDEVTKGLQAAARSKFTLNDQERQKLRAEAEESYQNAVYILEQTGSLPELSVIQKLQQLGRFLENKDTQEEGN